MSPILNRAEVEELSDSNGAVSRIFTSLDPGSGSLLTVAEVAIPRGRGTSAHKHKLTEEIYYVTAGEGEMRLDDETRRIGPGDCVVIEPGVLHELRNDDGSEPLVFIATCAPSVDPADFYAADGSPLGLHLDGPGQN